MLVCFLKRVYRSGKFPKICIKGAVGNGIWNIIAMPNILILIKELHQSKVRFVHRMLVLICIKRQLRRRVVVMAIHLCCGHMLGIALNPVNKL